MNKLKAATVVLGIFAGLGGASHGFGEILQGNVAPSQIMIKAWPGLTALGGEPAMTIVPNFILAGILTIAFGLIVAQWAGKYIDRNIGGLILALLSIVLLLVGGGIIPPLFGIAGGIVGAIMNYAAAKRGVASA